MYYLLKGELLFGGTCDTTFSHTYSDTGKPKCPVQSLGFAFGHAETTHVLTNLGYYGIFGNVHFEAFS